MTITIQDTDHLHEAANEFIVAFHDIIFDEHAVKCFAFHAPMGAGKTTFIKAICEELGSTDIITSPTFAIVNEYEFSPKDCSTFHSSLIYHFDFYRIKTAAELYDIGAEDYFYSGSPCFIEWPEHAASILPYETINVTITPNPDGSRIVTI